MDLFDLALYRALNKGGGGSSVTVEELTVNQNGTTTAPEGKAYSPVNVAVPNSYTAGDEGKVVSEGALVAQTAHATVTENGTIDTTLNNSVIVDVPQGGGGGAAEKAVNFRDYDGTIVASYTAAEFASLEALPNNPDRTSEGLTAQGWNWSLSDAKTYVAAYGRLEIGQMYVTTDGKTHVHIHLEQGRTSPMLGVCPNGTVDVDWGDGTAHDTLTGTSTSTVKWTPTHNYAVPGDYVIKLTVTGGMSFYGSSSSNTYSGLLRYSSSTDGRNYAYRNAIQKVEIGSSVTSISDYAFYYCYSLEAMTIPKEVTVFSYTSQFGLCRRLKHVTIPYGVTKLGGNLFAGCAALRSISIPNTVTALGSDVFQNCTMLKGLTLPNSITSLNGTFSGFYVAQKIILPDSITSFTGKVFYECFSLISITIPSGVTSLGTYTFQNCYSLGEVHFRSSTPPSLDTTTFTSCPSDFKIYVPTGSRETYMNAANYPSSSTHQYIEE